MDVGEDSSTLNELRLEGKLCDVVIRVADVDFNAHKIILCGCSNYFRTLFSDWTISEKLVYQILGVAPHMMGLLIEFAYTDSVPVTEDNVVELLVAADQFRVMGIVQACSLFLEDQLCPENCIGVWKLTDTYDCPDLRRKARLFILHHFEEMLSVSEELVEFSLQELADLIQEDELNVKKESTVLKAVLRWIAHSPQERNGHISTLLPKVRLDLMTSDNFLTNVRNNPRTLKSIAIVAVKSIYHLNQLPSISDDQNPLSRPRLPHAILLATGGSSGGSPTNITEAYDPRADRWVNLTRDGESPRAYHGTTFLNGFVYHIGGIDGIDHFNTVSKVDLATRTWHQVAPMHSRRCHVSVAVLDGLIYAMGGFDGHVRLNTAERYQPETNQWTQIAPMNQQRSNTSATTLHGKVYICGGYNGTECLSSAECYNPETNQWTMIAPMSVRRTGVGVVAYGEHIYAVGGCDGTNRLRSGEAYNPLMNSWRSVSSMFNPRSNFGLEVLDEQIFVVGGYDGSTSIFNVERYDKKTDEWNKAPDMEIHRSGLSCCVVSGLPNMAEYAAPRHAPMLPSVEEAAGGSI
ncbi:kelch-like protein 10 [Diretmus argenteus]